MKPAVYFFVLLFIAVQGCHKKPEVARTQVEMPPVGEVVDVVSRKWPEMFPRPEVERVLAHYPKSETIVNELEVALHKRGLDGLRGEALSRGIFLMQRDNKVSAVYLVSRREKSHLRLKPELVPYEVPHDVGFSSIDYIGEVAYVVESDFGNNFVLVENSELESQKQNIKSEDWPLNQRIAAQTIALPLTHNLIAKQCLSRRKEGPNALAAQMLLPIAEKLNSKSLIGLSLAEKAIVLRDALVASPQFKECPYASLQFLARGLDILTLFNSKGDPLVGLKAAFLGAMVEACRGAEGKIDLDNIGACFFDTVKDSSSTKAVSMIAAIGTSAKEWQLVDDLVAEVAESIGDESAGTFCSLAMKFGFQSAACLKVSGLSSRPNRDALTATVTVKDSSGNIKSRATEKYEISGQLPLPIITASIDTDQIDNCAVPVFYKKEWWSVCPATP